jgi:spoIIIJ-associated protein
LEPLLFLMGSGFKLVGTIDPVINSLSSTAPQTIRSLLQKIVGFSGLELSFDLIRVGEGEPVPEVAGSSPAAPVASPAGPGVGRIEVEFKGPDTPLLTARNGELLHALEHIAAKALRLEQEEHDRISFDADAYKAKRDRALSESADHAVASVRTTGRPYTFPPMNSRERRLLHLALSGSGLPTASSGEVPRRFVVLYPEGHEIVAPSAATAVPVPDRARAIRNSFRRR